MVDKHKQKENNEIKMLVNKQSPWTVFWRRICTFVYLVNYKVRLGSRDNWKKRVGSVVCEFDILIWLISSDSDFCSRLDNFMSNKVVIWNESERGFWHFWLKISCGLTI